MPSRDERLKRQARRRVLKERVLRTQLRRFLDLSNRRSVTIEIAPRTAVRFNSENHRFQDIVTAIASAADRLSILAARGTHNGRELEDILAGLSSIHSSDVEMPATLIAGDLWSFVAFFLCEQEAYRCLARCSCTRFFFTRDARQQYCSPCCRRWAERRQTRGRVHRLRERRTSL